MKPNKLRAVGESQPPEVYSRSPHRTFWWVMAQTAKNDFDRLKLRGCFSIERILSFSTDIV